MILIILISLIYGQPDQPLLIEGFSDSLEGKFPAGWKWIAGHDLKEIGKYGPDKIPYIVRSEGGNNYLHAEDSGQAITIVSDKKWNIKKYPCLSWRWRVHTFPAGANERIKGKGDSAASLFVTFYVNVFKIPKSIRFIWSNVLPYCDSFQKDGIGQPFITVMQTGMDHKDQWNTETINLYRHYKKLYGSNPPDEIVGIAIRTDADGTRSRAVADYDDIIVSTSCNSECDE
jgi:hypothetical protein